MVLNDMLLTAKLPGSMFVSLFDLFGDYAKKPAHLA